MCSLSLQNEFWKYFAALYKTWILTGRNAFTIVEVVFWPTVALVTIGFLTAFLRLEENEVSFILIGAIALGVLQVSQVNIAYTVLFDVWSKSVKHTFTCPVKGHHLILGSLLLGIIMGSIVFLILMAFSYYVFDFNFLVGGPIPILVFLVGLFFECRDFRNNSMHLRTYLREACRNRSMEFIRNNVSPLRHILSNFGVTRLHAGNGKSHTLNLLFGILQIILRFRQS